MKDQEKISKILAVDDVSENLDILIATLKSDYKIVAARNGENALKLALAKIPPDLILLDIIMPEMDGYEICRRLKSNEKTKDIPVIFITAVSESMDEAKAFQVGAVDYITKPFNPPTVKARIKTHLELKRYQNHLEDLVKQRTYELEIAKSEAEEAKKKYFSIFENAAEGIAQISPSGKIISANPAMSFILGYESLDEMLSLISNVKKQCYVNPEDRLRVENMIQKIDRVSGIEMQFLRKDGSVFWGSESIRAVRDENSNILYYEGSLIDITERKKKEEAERLIKVAEMATKTKNEFLANMSHEIRTPMNAIINFIELSLNTDLPPKIFDYLKMAKNASHMLLSIIDDILDFSKIEANKLILEQIPFDLEEVFNKVSNIIGLKAEDKGLELLYSLDKNMPLNLIGDPLRLSQVLINLCNNAIKFTDSGEIVIHAEKVNEDREKVVIKFSVKDTGIGIHHDQISELFQVFVQGDSSITRKYGGTGLGLSICDKLVHLMGGEMSVKGEPGKGSTFIFTTTFGVPVNENINENLFNHTKNDVDRINLKDITVLLVEDNEFNRLLATEFLYTEGINVIIAQNGIDAIHAVNNNHIDAVLMDIQMPEMDGYEATQQIRRDPRFKDLPIIALTAHAMLNERNKCFEAGMNDHLPKPIIPNKLFETLRKWVKPIKMAEKLM
ncbi:MAG: response regulator [Desulfobacterales bacterium]|nr:response regulator [Desulfobacterales bacterium]